MEDAEDARETSVLRVVETARRRDASSFSLSRVWTVASYFSTSAIVLSPRGPAASSRRLVGLLGGKKEREKPGRERLGAGEGLLGPGRACGGGIYESAVRGRRPGDANPVNLHLHQVQLFPATIRTRLACLSESFSVACQEHQSSASALDDCHEGCGCPCCPLLQAWSSR